MCIFCGGQCGGTGEFLISLGLPFLALYFSRIKNALIRIKNKIIRRGAGAEEIAGLVKGTGSVVLLKDWSQVTLQSIDLQKLELLEYKPQDN